MTAPRRYTNSVGEGATPFAAERPLSARGSASPRPPSPRPPSPAVDKAGGPMPTLVNAMSMTRSETIRAPDTMQNRQEALNSRLKREERERLVALRQAEDLERRRAKANAQRSSRARINAQKTELQLQSQRSASEVRAQNRRLRLEADARREEYRDRGFALTIAHSNARAKAREKARPPPYPTRARVCVPHGDKSVLACAHWRSGNACSSNAKAWVRPSAPRPSRSNEASQRRGKRSSRRSVKPRKVHVATCVFARSL